MTACKFGDSNIYPGYRPDYGLNKPSIYRSTHQSALLKKSCVWKLWIEYCSVTDRWSYSFYFTDVNECNTGVHLCEHKCHNTPGSYGCSCFHGYRQRADMRTCEGRLYYATATLEQIHVVMIVLRVYQRVRDLGTNVIEQRVQRN